MTIVSWNRVWNQIGWTVVVAAMVAWAFSGSAWAAEPEISDIPAVKWMLKPRPAPNADAKSEAEMKAYTEDLGAADVKFDMVPIKGGKFKYGFDLIKQMRYVESK